VHRNRTEGGADIPRVIHFEINVDQPERAIRFYTDVFGWKIWKWEGPEDYWLITTGEGQPGIDGALMKRMNPSATTVNTIEVPSVDDFVAKITANGGKVVAPKVAIPGVGYFAHCQDTEGNTFGIIQEDKMPQ
jgi:predicted enzyme related to lactoylglutathione lyase